MAQEGPQEQPEEVALVIVPVPDASTEAAAELAELEQAEGIEWEAFRDACERRVALASALLDDLIARILWKMEVADMGRPCCLPEVPGRGEDRLLRPATGAGGDAHMEDFCRGLRGQGMEGSVRDGRIPHRVCCLIESLWGEELALMGEVPVISMEEVF